MILYSWYHALIRSEVGFLINGPPMNTYYVIVLVPKPQSKFHIVPYLFLNVTPSNKQIYFGFKKPGVSWRKSWMHPKNNINNAPKGVTFNPFPLCMWLCVCVRERRNRKTKPNKQNTHTHTHKHTHKSDPSKIVSWLFKSAKSPLAQSNHMPYHIVTHSWKHVGLTLSSPSCLLDTVSFAPP